LKHGEQYHRARLGSRSALASVLTPDRLSRLKDTGYSDPGRGPNYWKICPFDAQTDAGVARELLTLPFDVYGFRGPAGLVFEIR
jgi:hypothetical protein